MSRKWARFWTRVAGIPSCRRIATGLALLGAPPPLERVVYATFSPRGWIDPRATLWGPTIQLGLNVYIDKGVQVYQETNAGQVEVGDHIRLYEDTHILVGAGGSVHIGAETSIHRGCQIESYKAAIQIGSRVEIAACCSILSFDHGTSANQHFADQELVSKGPIIIEDDVWLGHGVIVLSGVRIGKGAVIGAGSVVTKDVPTGVVTVGVPARIVRTRADVSDSNRLMDNGC